VLALCNTRYNRLDMGRMLLYNARSNENIDLGAIHVEV
jgi:hypothetical protein